MAGNIFPRLQGGFGNIEGRAGGGEQQSDVVVSLSGLPARIELGAAAGIRLEVSRNGLPYAGAAVTFTNTDPLVSAAPDEATINPNGLLVFVMIGLAIGETVLTATVDGVSSDPLTITVVDEVLVVDYAAQGTGVITVECEMPLADALTAKVSRMTDADQKAYDPSDTACEHVAQMTEREIVFFLPGR